MGKAQRNRDVNARARIAQEQAAMQRAERRRRLVAVTASTVLVIAVVAVIIVIKVVTTTKQAGGGRLPATVTGQISNVPASTLSKIGTGGLAAAGLPLKSISDTALATSQGKPQFLYIGAEFCPYCAAMRWPMAVALSRFGTFGPLNGIHSSSTDVYPNTATLTFYKQRYSSPYLTFTPVENQTVSKQPLQPVTKEQQAVWAKYDTIQGSQGYPFLYFGGRVIITGPLYNPGVLKGLSWSQISSQLSNPISIVAQNINGAANYITASICKMTKDSPASVCKAAPIPAIEPKI
jgi:hypothetical protein